MVSSKSCLADPSSNPSTYMRTATCNRIKSLPLIAQSSLLGYLFLMVAVIVTVSLLLLLLLLFVSSLIVAIAYRTDADASTTSGQIFLETSFMPTTWTFGVGMQTAESKDRANLPPFSKIFPLTQFCVTGGGGFPQSPIFLIIYIISILQYIHIYHIHYIHISPPFSKKHHFIISASYIQHQKK